MSRPGDPLLEMLDALREDDLERIAKAVSAAHRAAAGKAQEKNEPRIAKFHQRCAGDVLKALREIDQ
jgi:hypothetical protein